MRSVKRTSTQALAVLFFLVLSGALFAAGISGGSVLVTIVNSNSRIPREQMSDKLQGRSVETAGLHGPSSHKGSKLIKSVNSACLRCSRRGVAFSNSIAKKYRHRRRFWKSHSSSNNGGTLRNGAQRLQIRQIRASTA